MLLAFDAALGAACGDAGEAVRERGDPGPRGWGDDVGGERLGEEP